MFQPEVFFKKTFAELFNCLLFINITIGFIFLNSFVEDGQ